MDMNLGITIDVQQIRHVNQIVYMFLLFKQFLLMQAKKNANIQITGRKGTSSRVGTQQNLPNNQQSNNNLNAMKQREQAIASIVKQYLEKNGYLRSFQTFKNQKPIKRITPTSNTNKQASSGMGTDDEKYIINLFDKGSRDQFFKQTSKLFSIGIKNAASQQIVQALRRLEFELNIYFCIYNLHPCTPGTSKKSQQVEKSAAEAFKKYIDTKGQQISQQSQLLSFFALPYIPKPQQNPSMARVFTKEWLQRLKANLQQAVREFTARNTAGSNKQNKKSNYQSSLHQIYDKFVESSVSQSRIKQQGAIDYKQIQKYERQIQQLKLHNKQMVSYLDIMQQNLKDLNQASKINLVQSNRKWFQFSKQIMQITKRALKGENVRDKLQKYERFFGTNIDELIYCTDEISLFQKNSYTEDHSMIPRGTTNDRNANIHSPQIAPIDYGKIASLLAKADKIENQLQICLVLKALKERLCCHKSAYTRRQVVVSYQRNDVCAIKQSNYFIQKKLLLESPQRVKQFYLRLMNYISTDDLGNQYLSGSQKLIQNLICIMGTTTQDIPYRKHVFGVLQRFSFIKQSQLMMISFGIIPMIFKIFRNQAESLQDTSIQYLMGLIMNLAVKKQSIINFQKHKSQIIPILLKYIDVDDNQIKGYVNGTLYVLLQLQSIKRQAIQKYKIKQIIRTLLDKSNSKYEQSDADDNDSESCVIRQYSYILERLEQKNTSTLEGEQDNYDDDDDDQQYIDDVQEMEVLSDNQSNSSEYIDGEDNLLNGEELLMKKYALLGPEAVRQEIINRSILDQTSRKSNNMTTSINHSKRIDKVFQKNQRPQTPSLLPGNLDLSITPNK